VNTVLLSQYVAIGASVLVAVLLALLVYNRRERRRYRAAAVAGELEQWGLSKLAGVFRAYAVGDYSGLVRSVDQLYERIQGTEGTLGLLSELFWKLLAPKLTEADSRIRIRQQLEAAESTAKSKTGT